MPRCYFHDYQSRCIYHITLKKAKGVPVFGNLCGDCQNATIERSQLGKIIEKQIRKIYALNPAIRLLQYSIMPDHVHMLIFVTSHIEMHLGKYISKLKILIYQDFREMTGDAVSIFEEDFYDCILYNNRSLDTLFKYLRDNPRRLAVRRAHPEFFRRVNRLKIGEKYYQAYGNFQLLECPFKEQVVVHRADTPEVRERNRQVWLYAAANGGVLVSPFISQAEKAIRTEVYEAGGRFVYITNQSLAERYKPSGRDFELCETGRMLIVSASLDGDLNRTACLTMNSLAETISKD